MQCETVHLWRRVIGHYLQRRTKPSDGCCKAKGHQARNEGAFFLAQTWAAISASRQQAARKTRPCFPKVSDGSIYPWLLLARPSGRAMQIRVCLLIHFGGFPFRRQTFFRSFEPLPFTQPRVLTKRRSKPRSQRRQTSQRFWRIQLRQLALP